MSARNNRRFLDGASSIHHGDRRHDGCALRGMWAYDGIYVAFGVETCHQSERRKRLCSSLPLSALSTMAGAVDTW